MTHPSTTLLVAPAASGKTETALQTLREPRRGRAMLLVRDEVQQNALKARLTAMGIRRRVTVAQFYGLARLILRRSHPTLTTLHETTRAMLIRSLLRDLAAQGTLPTFAPIVEKPGVIATIGALLHETQAAEVDPQQLAQATVSPYDAELGAVYAAYQSTLERLNLADMHRRLTLAREEIARHPDTLTGWSLLIVDGFDQFTPVQLGLLQTLAQMLERTIVTLTWSGDKRPAHRRFARTYTQLVAALQPEIVPMPVSFASHRAPALHHIEQHMFNLNQPAPHAAQGSITLIEAADRTREVRAALRRVHTLLRDGTPAEQIAVLMRNEAAYEPLLREVAAEYALPLALYRGLPLLEAPSTIALLTMLRLPLDNFSRRGVVETWRSFADGRLPINTAPAALREPPLALDHAASLLDCAARHAGLSDGVSRYQHMLRRLAEVSAAQVEDENTPLLSAAVAADLLTMLTAFAEWLTPPAEAAIGDYVAWVAERSHSSEPHTEQARRWHAMLHALAESAALLNEPPLSYRAFLNELGMALAAARYGRVMPGRGQVAALPVLAARGLHFDHVVLVGMSEGEFPPPLPEPPIYSRRERAALAQQGVLLVPPDPADERSLFYETIARARRSLTLTRTYLDERGNPLQRSPYLHAVLSLVTLEHAARHHISAGSVVPLNDAVSPQEHLIAVMADPADGDRAALLDQSLHTLLAHVERACSIERLRESTEGYSICEGVVHDPHLKQQIAQQFGPDHRWSVTQFNDYITCPFRFAAAHVLKLTRRAEPEEGLDTARRGQLYHAILARAGTAWEAAQHTFTSDHEPAILQSLHTAADHILAHAPTDYGFAPGVFWGWEQADIRRRLEQALRRVIESGSDWAPFRPLRFEQGFGLHTDDAPFTLTTAAGVVLVKGRIDRIDQHQDGTLAVLDYKSSSSPRPLKDTLKGDDVQLTIYLLATEARLVPQQHVERVAFLHLGSGKISAPLTDKHRDEAIAALHQRVSEAVQGIRAGYFAVQPRDKCPTSCAFAAICRLNIAKRDAHLAPTTDETG